MSNATPNHTIDPATGFLESNNYIQAFDASRKVAFLNLLRANSLGLYKTCKQLGLSHHTVNKHYHQDAEFKRQYDDLETEYASDLEAVSRQNALNPRSVIERIFQLKALLPNKYADQKSLLPSQITINIDGKLIEQARERTKILDIQEVVDGQVLTSASNEGDRRITVVSDQLDDTSTTPSSTSGQR